ncbi:uncharacterized protein [Leptinotarsa decemlineata]|uniref:uncharacterized protein n=1 Tax=Leptinotarsa decemlineata TaxID=7539 RepID=UPI003D3098FE
MYNFDAGLKIIKGKVKLKHEGQELSYPESYDLEGVKQIQWERQNEIDGIKSFEKVTGAKVMRTGLWLHTCGFLEAYPDGLFFSDGIIEVKCPYTLRNSLLADNLKKSDILFSENGEYIANKDHNYYHQIQGQLHITGRDYCYLVLWTTADVAIKKIEKDKSWEKIFIY